MQPKELHNSEVQQWQKVKRQGEKAEGFLQRMIVCGHSEKDGSYL